MCIYEKVYFFGQVMITCQDFGINVNRVFKGLREAAKNEKKIYRMRDCFCVSDFFVHRLCPGYE